MDRVWATGLLLAVVLFMLLLALWPGSADAEPAEPPPAEPPKPQETLPEPVLEAPEAPPEQPVEPAAPATTADPGEQDSESIVSPELPRSGG